MSDLQIFLFDKFQVRCQERVLAGLQARKVQELFSYLLLYRDHHHPRETLADLLWGDISSAQSKGYLRKALWQLQAALDSHREPYSGRVLLVESDWAQINPEADFWLDAAEFERTFMLVQGLSGQEIDFRGLQVLLKAVDLYQGDLLEGWYRDWCLHERERFQHMYLAMLDKLMDYCEVHQEKVKKGLRTPGMRGTRPTAGRIWTSRMRITGPKKMGQRISMRPRMRG